MEFEDNFTWIEETTTLEEENEYTTYAKAGAICS